MSARRAAAFAGVALAAGCAAASPDWSHPPDEVRTLAVVERVAAQVPRCPAEFRAGLERMVSRAGWRVVWIDDEAQAPATGAQRLLVIRGTDAGAGIVRDVTRFIISRAVFADRSAQLVELAGPRVLWEDTFHEEREVPGDPARPGGIEAFIAALDAVTQASCRQVEDALRGAAGLGRY